MLLQKKTINNVPTLVPLTADTGSGVPVGTIIGQYKKVNMAGYLYLDGSTFDQTLYPALYAYLGTNVLPDYREFVLVGAEQNTTSATIADHDVFTQGQEKDDQLQSHTHSLGTTVSAGVGPGSLAQYTQIQASNIFADNYDTGATGGTTTRTKEKAVFWYIKATTGIIESEATEMLNVINENNSYSTNEVATGKTWIDGKPIYRKVVNFGALPNYTSKSVAHNISNLGTVVSLSGFAVSPSNEFVPLPYVSLSSQYEIQLSANSTSVIIFTGTDLTNRNAYVTIEYTKTTD